MLYQKVAYQMSFPHTQALLCLDSVLVGPSNKR